MTLIFKRLWEPLFLLFAGIIAFQANAEGTNDEAFYAFQDHKVFVEKDSMYRVGSAVIFKYRIDVDDGQHPWEKLTRTVKTQCDSNNFMNINTIITFKDSKEPPQEIKGKDEYFQYDPKSYREEMTKYVCENAPN
jgi:hypothetical protein